MSSSTFSSKRWLGIFFALVAVVSVGFLGASEWLVRTKVVPQDNFEWIAARLRNSQQAKAAFGDSHVAAVPDYNTADFVNLGIGATTIRRMDQRVRYYFGKIKPDEVIIQADPHLFAEYRLEARESYVPEAYSESRLRVLDPRHRSFMIKYWTTLLATGRLKEQENTGYDRLWDAANTAQKDSEKPAKEDTPKPSQETPAPQQEAAKPPAVAAPPQAAATPTAVAVPPQAAATPTAVAAPPQAATTPTTVAAPPPQAAAAPAQTPEAPKKPAEAPKKVATLPTLDPVTPGSDPQNPGKIDSATLAKFDAFMEYEVSTHTPVLNFRERDEANIYREMIKFLIARGAKVCLMNYPVDKFYRERADAIPAFAETRKFYKEVARENHIPYVSFWDRFDDPSMYQNTDHVNQKGSPILAREARAACFGKPGS